VYRERGELPPFFAGLLPEGALRRRLAATRKSDRDINDFGILAAAGEDLPGAVTVVPANLDNLPAAVRAYGVTGGADNLEISMPEQPAEGGSITIWRARQSGAVSCQRRKAVLFARQRQTVGPYRQAAASQRRLASYE
jgi:hypothetical protein